MGEWNITHREKLLSDLWLELDKRIAAKKNLRMGIQPSKYNPTNTDVECINVTFLLETGEELMSTDFTTALKCLVEDIYWDENGDWSDAFSLRFE